MEITESLKIRIKKLLDKANSAKSIGNIEESIAFTDKVNEMLLRYNLEMAEINTVSESTQLTEDGQILTVSMALNRWTQRMLDVLCKFNFCTCIYHDCGRKELAVTIIGNRENINAVAYLYEVLKSQFENMAKAKYKAYVDSVRNEFIIAEDNILADMVAHNNKISDYKKVKGGYVYKKLKKHLKGVVIRPKYYKSFFLGAIKGIYIKLDESHNKMKNNTDDFSKKITALVLSNESKLVEYVNQRFNNMSEFGSRKLKVCGEAYQAGEEAGKNASFAQGLANGDSIAVNAIE